MSNDPALQKIALELKQMRERMDRIEQTCTQRRGTMRTTIRDTVRQTLIEIGVERDSPLEMQRDFIYLRQWRMTHEKLGFRAAATLIAILIGGLIAAIWAGLRTFLEST